MRSRGSCGLVAAGLTWAALTGCTSSNDAGDTLAPLPISGPPTPPPTTATSLSTSTATSASGETADAPLLVGDWDGAEFDVGMIASVGELGGYRTIDFDRFSYDDPERGVIDAAAFVEEPIAFGWTDSPFVNIQEQLRTFVLADDVEVLVLGADVSCEDPGRRPPPTWISAGVSHLDEPAATEDIASLTYSDDGLVSRIRFTRGCE
jgi:hypothetical protein